MTAHVPEIDEIAEWVTLRKAAALLGTTDDNVRKLVHRQRVIAQRWGSRELMIDKASLETYRQTPLQRGRPKVNNAIANVPRGT